MSVGTSSHESSVFLFVIHQRIISTLHGVKFLVRRLDVFLFSIIAHDDLGDEDILIVLAAAAAAAAFS